MAISTSQTKIQQVEFQSITLEAIIQQLLADNKKIFSQLDRINQQFDKIDQQLAVLVNQKKTSTTQLLNPALQPQA